MIVLAIVVAVVVAGWAGWTFYQSKQEQQASIALGSALRTYTAPIRPGTEAKDPDNPNASYGSVQERGAAAFAEFQQVAEKYPHVRSGHYATYMAGVAALDKGDNATAEKMLKQAADTDKFTAPMAKFALAGLYRSQNKTDDAAKYYREVISADSVTVPKSQAQLELAEMYEPKNPAEAVKVYEEIIKDEQARTKELQAQDKTAKSPATPQEDVKSPLQQQAEAKIAQLKGAANKK
jgi:predicted negative regulator of RcsB-dependent stress response